MKKTGFIFSVYKADLDLHLNKLNHKNTLKSLDRTNGKFKSIFETTGNNVKPSIYIEPNNNTLNELRQFVNALCIQHNQDSFLEVSPERLVKRFNSSGESEVLGNLISVTQCEAEKDPTFIYCPKTEQHFVIRL